MMNLRSLALPLLLALACGGPYSAAPGGPSAAFPVGTVQIATTIREGSLLTLEVVSRALPGHPAPDLSMGIEDVQFRSGDATIRPMVSDILNPRDLFIQLALPPAAAVAGSWDLWMRPPLFGVRLDGEQPMELAIPAAFTPRQ